MRWIYSFIIYLFSPLVLFYLNKKSKKNSDYKYFWNERFARKLINPSNKPIVWLHSVSVGEVRAMVKIIEILQTKYNHYQILITVMTPTGRNTAKTLYPNAIVHYIPYDLPYAVKNFYNTFQPKLALIMETEI